MFLQSRYAAQIKGLPPPLPPLSNTQSPLGKSQTSNWNLAFLLIMNVGNKPQQY